jgi:hypothetical protein
MFRRSSSSFCCSAATRCWSAASCRFASAISAAERDCSCSILSSLFYRKNKRVRDTCRLFRHSLIPAEPDVTPSPVAVWPRCVGVAPSRRADAQISVSQQRVHQHRAKTVLSISTQAHHDQVTFGGCLPRAHSAASVTARHESRSL